MEKPQEKNVKKNCVADSELFHAGVATEDNSLPAIRAQKEADHIGQPLCKFLFV